MATKGACPPGGVKFRGRLKKMSGLPRIAGSAIKGALGGAYARHKQSEGNEASGEPAQSNAQGPPNCAKAQG
jgi:hypothetical protein